MVIWTPTTYSEDHTYFTMSKESFCEYIVIDGKRKAKFKRDTSMKAHSVLIDDMEEIGFRGPMRKEPARVPNEYDGWRPISGTSYYEYAKDLCERYRLAVRKHDLCVTEKRYIGISRSEFEDLRNDLRFLKNSLKTVLKDQAGYFEERFVQGFSIRKYAQVHDLNRGSVDYLQRKFFSALAALLKEQDAAEGRNRLKTEE